MLFRWKWSQDFGAMEDFVRRGMGNGYELYIKSMWFELNKMLLKNTTEIESVPDGEFSFLICPAIEKLNRILTVR